MCAVDKAHTFHVGLNAHLLSLSQDYRGAGANWYIYHMLRHLPAADPALRYTAFTSAPRFSPPAGMRIHRPRWSTATPLGRITWEQAVAPLALRREQVDLLHAMAFVAPLLAPCPTVVTIFDLSFVFYPQAFKPFKRLYLQLMTRLSAHRARRVIAISEHTRRDVITCLGVSATNVCAVPCGVDPTLTPVSPAEAATFRRDRGLPERFVLFLGTIEPRKNVPHLIDAFADLTATDLSDTYLIIAGGRGWMAESAFARVEERGVQDRVRFVGYVPEAEKRLWYGAATCFCYPSLYEGFGLPPLEAMACGTPVIVSNSSSLPEVVGDAGMIVPPDDRPALREALHKLLSDPRLREQLRAKGLARARRFSWAEAARQTARVYRQALEER